jgi:hypothetical protein
MMKFSEKLCIMCGETLIVTSKNIPIQKVLCYLSDSLKHGACPNVVANLC